MKRFEEVSLYRGDEQNGVINGVRKTSKSLFAKFRNQKRSHAISTVKKGGGTEA
jgi:hypothetical protein